MLSALQSFAQTTDDLMYQSYQTTTSAPEVNPAFIGFMVVFGLVLLVLAVVGMWKVFAKAGKPGWAALVPFYNAWVLSEIAGRPGWFGLVAVFVGFIPFLGAIISLIMVLLISLDVAVKFGKSKAFGVIGLWLFSFIGYLLLGFGDAKYDASIKTDTPQFGTPTQPTAAPQA